MKKDNGLTDALNDLMGDSTTIHATPSTAPSMTLQMKMKQRKENMKQHNFRMKDSEWNWLKEHFQDKGLSVAGGLRMIILDYMNKNRH